MISVKKHIVTLVRNPDFLLTPKVLLSKSNPRGKVIYIPDKQRFFVVRGVVYDVDDSGGEIKEIPKYSLPTMNEKMFNSIGEIICDEKLRKSLDSPDILDADDRLKVWNNNKKNL